MFILTVLVVHVRVCFAGSNPSSVVKKEEVVAPPPAVDKAEEKEDVGVASPEVAKEDSAPPAPEPPKPVPVSANAFASGSNPNGPQVMTGRPTSRVLMPGGGGGPVSWKLG
jgi:hypothetical protein